MLQHLKPSTYHTKDNNRRPYLILKLSCLIVTLFILMSILPNAVIAQAGMNLYDYSVNNTINYTNKLVTVTLNGKTISNSDTPGILVDGYAMVPYDDIFEKSFISAECIFDDQNGTISISKYNKTIIMTIGSTNASLNGKSVKLPAAPMKIKYEASGITKVLVPSRYISESIGLGYTWNKSKNTVAIQKKSILLSYNGGSQFEYTGTKGKVTISGKSLNLGSMPSIIMNNTAMLSAKKVFADSSIKADYIYDKANQTVTLTKNGNVLVMTIGNKTAYLNGAMKTISTAPVFVKNIETGYSYVMVPGSFTAESLGYTYKWNSSTKTSVITAKSSDTSKGDSDNIIKTGTIIKEWSTLPEQYGISSNTHEINGSSAPIGATGTINSVTRDYTKVKPNTETFMFTATVPYHNISTTTSGRTLALQVDNQGCNSQTYQMYGVMSNMVNTISLINYDQGNESSITLDIIQDNYQYDISLSEDKCTLFVTIYNNAITSAKIGTGSNGDYLIFNGTGSFQAAISESSGNLYIDLPNSANILGNIVTALSGTNFMKSFSIISNTNETQAVLSLKDGYQYSLNESNNQLTIILQAKKATDGNHDDNDYEVVIPKLESIDSSMISDEDYYLSHYFVITLEGDYVDYFNNNPIMNSGAMIKNITVSLNNRGNTQIKIATTKLQGYKLDIDASSICVHVGNPRSIYKNIVVLDPGHGGDKVGALAKNGDYEKDINFNILYTIGKKYFNQDPSKLKVYYTRTSDADISLDDRAAFASKVGADLFVSLHMNSAPNAQKACGTETFYSESNNKANDAGLTSQKLATMLLNNLYPELGTSKRGVKSAKFVVVHKNTVPAVLIELGFLTNSKDYSVIMDKEKREATAKTIYNTLLEVFDEYPTGR